MGAAAGQEDMLRLVVLPGSASTPPSSFSSNSCSCSGDKQDSSVDNIKYGDDGTMGSVNTIQPFPSTDQIWGMVGTILAIGAVWMLFTTMKRRKAPPRPHVVETQQRGGDKQREAGAARAAPLAQNSQRDTHTNSNPRCK